MRYTLESITLIEEILKNKLNLQSGEIKSIPVSLNIDDISYRENNQYYFGYINAGDNIDTIDLNLFGLNTIKMDSNSQITDLFSWVEYSVIDAKFPKGHFIGFRIIVANNQYVEPVYI